MWYNQGTTNVLWERFRKIASSSKGWLQVRTSGCSVCQQMYRADASDSHSVDNFRVAANLCQDCRALIPWIKVLKCDTCGRGDECPDCVRREQTYFAANRSAVRYMPIMKEWLARYKYRGDERFADLLAQMLEAVYRQWSSKLGTSPNAWVCLTYVPLSESRLESRGFNQAEQLARRMGHSLGLPVIGLLKRKHDTGKQSYKTRAERLADLENVFELDYKGLELLEDAVLKGAKDTPSGWIDREIVLWVVDDVYTTGSTMNQCAKVLTSTIKCKVYSLCWAR